MDPLIGRRHCSRIMAHIALLPWAHSSQHWHFGELLPYFSPFSSLSIPIADASSALPRVGRTPRICACLFSMVVLTPGLPHRSG